MLSLFSFGASKEMSLTGNLKGMRPEVLRRKTILNNAWLTLAAAAIAAPFAVASLVAGAVLPFVVSALVLACGMTALGLHQRGAWNGAAAVQVYGLMALGLIFSLVDARLCDEGLAMILMGSVLAALLMPTAQRKDSWKILGVVLAAVAVAHLALPASAAPIGMLSPTSMAGLLLSLLLVAHSAHRINAGYEVADKAQVTAYRHLIEHVQDGVIRFSEDGEILLASRSSESLFGCRRFELNEASLGERLHVLDRPAYLTAFADANQAGRSRTIEVRMRKDDPQGRQAPSFIWVEIGLSPVRDDLHASQRYEVIALFRDITVRKDNEVAMSEARRQAEAASEAKSRFLATIGHELRTPLNAVVGFSEMMTAGIGGDLSGTHREYAGLIHQSGKHLLDVVGMLLDMSKLEAGKFELQTEPFNLAGIIEPSLQMVAAMAGERKIQLSADVAADLPLLTGDERACRQILLNLLSNAVKFSRPEGMVTVSVRRQGTYLKLAVTDRGIGMAPESLSRIGEPFFQVQDGLTRRYEGTGLGLSIVKGLVDLHGGTLRAMSEIGAGTTVTVLLPINGPAIKTGDTAVVTPFRKEPAAPIPSWQNEKRKAQ